MKCEVCCKNIHDSRADAGNVLRLTPGKQLHVYPCPVGNGWHIGHHGTARKRPPIEEHKRDRMLRLPRYALAKEMMTR